MSNITFSPKEPLPIVDEDIMVGSVKVGWVKEYINSAGATKFHCGLNIDVNDMFPALIQGHGDSKEAAIEDAITKGYKYATALYEGINKMQFEMGLVIANGG